MFSRRTLFGKRKGYSNSRLTIIYNSETNKFYFHTGKVDEDVDYQIIKESERKIISNEFHDEVIDRYKELSKVPMRLESIFSYAPYKTDSIVIETKNVEELKEFFIQSALKSGQFDLYRTNEVINIEKATDFSDIKINWRHILIFEQLQGKEIPWHVFKLVNKENGHVVAGITRGRDIERCVSEMLTREYNELNHTAIKAYNLYFEGRLYDEFDVFVSDKFDTLEEASNYRNAILSIQEEEF